MAEINLTQIDDIRTIITTLCKLFYKKNWVTGTGGGISVRCDKNRDFVYLTPSGVQKEYIDNHDLFVYSLENDQTIERPINRNLKMSECTPLFLTAYQLRDAGAVMHSHSIHAAFLTVLVKGNEFRISHQEMIKGIKKGSSKQSLRYDDTLIVPIIENTPFEKDLTSSLKKAIEDYPDTNAVLVRRHGVYIWSTDWKQTKIHAECYHYLFEMAVKMIQSGLETVQK